MKHSTAFLQLGLGLAAGAVLQWVPCRVAAQVVPPPASEIPVPPKPKSDSLPAPRDTIPRDTIKAPIGRAPLTAAPGIAGGYRWAGDTITATGAYTLTDLLARIPEITTFRSAWIASPQTAALAGDFSRLRIFADGVEIDAIDPRERAIHDLAHIPIWSLDDVVIERAAGEVRVHLRTWSVNRTTPYTRTDVYTGNEETDIYRGFYGKRFTNGVAFQAAAEQSATQNVRIGGGGDALSLFARFGVGKRRWSLDGFAERTHYHRASQFGLDVPDLPTYDATHTIGYLRAAVGRAERGPWLELIAANHRVKEGSPHLDSTRAASLGVPRDTVDTAITRIQYVAQGGVRLGAAALTLTHRMRRYAAVTVNSESARLDLKTSWASATAFAERDNERRLTTADAQVELRPLRFLSFSGALQRHSAEEGSVFPTETAQRGEVGLRLFGIWAYGGATDVQGEVARAPIIYDTTYRRTPSGNRSALFGGLRGSGWRGLGADAYIIRWESGAQYLPEYQARAELNFQTEWRSRFPRGDFGFNIAVADDFRSGVVFPLATGFRRAGASHVLWGLMEIRIQRAALTFQVRNPIGKFYFQVPGFEMPRAVSTYGVRWFFWN